ncbi:glycosyltransferase [candidate division KSB1 bacterium]|nr:glycosyltransferase [candidate division KSB1 bacterium]
MSVTLQEYAKITGDAVIDQLVQLSKTLKGKKVVHVNSTRVGGGVAEILDKLVPLMNELGIETSWEVINGDAPFYQCTKGFHNALQGDTVEIPDTLLKVYESTNQENFKRLKPELKDADIVIIHDPQPAPFLSFCPGRKGKWVWRCHIDVSRPYRPVWKYLRNFVVGYDASIFSLDVFSQRLPHPQYLISPSIDPLSEKNIDLPQKEIVATCHEHKIDMNRPLITQVSRYDRFKDPIGVVHAFQLARKFVPDLQLVLAGGGATDDPEGEAVLNEVYAAAGDDKSIHVLLLPSDAHRTINALQRASDIVLQKSIKEGFGLTVTEAMWKGKPVIGGNVGGIRLQVHNHHNGFLVDTPEGAAMRIRYLYFNRDIMAEMGKNAHRFVLENFLITRHLREYLTLMVGLLHGNQSDRIELG